MYDYRIAWERIKGYWRKLLKFVRMEKAVWLKDFDTMREDILVTRTLCQRLWRDRYVATEAETLQARGQQDRRRETWPGTGDD